MSERFFKFQTINYIIEIVENKMKNLRFFFLRTYKNVAFCMK